MLINRALIPSMILSVTIVAGGCNNKTKSQAPELSVPVFDTAFAAAADNQDFERLLTVKRRNVKPADAKVALSKMGLGEAQNGAFRWAGKTSENGDVTYQNLTVTGEDGEDIKIGALTLTGAHMKGDTPSFDRLDIAGLNILDEGTTLGVDRVSLARPAPALGASIMRAIDMIQTTGRLGNGPKLEDEDIGFGALLIDNLVMTSDKTNLSLDSVGWGEDETTGKAIFLLEDIQIDTPSHKGTPAMNMSLGSVSATDIDMDVLRKLQKDSSGEGANTAPANFNIFSPILKGFSVRDFGLSMDSLSVVAPRIDTTVEESSGTSVITQNMAPVTIGFSKRPENHDMAKAWKNMKMAGYDQIEISGASVTTLNEAEDSFSVENGFFRLKDGFDLNFASKGNGLKAVTAGGSEEDINAALDSMTFDKLEMSLTDRSIVNRAVAVAVEEKGIPEVFVRMLVKGSIMGGGAMAAQQAGTPAQEAAISDMVNALGGFIDNGGTISIGMTPPSPIAMSELKNLQPQSADPERLGLTITHQK